MKHGCPVVLKTSLHCTMTYSLKMFLSLSDRNHHKMLWMNIMGESICSCKESFNVRQADCKTISRWPCLYIIYCYLVVGFFVNCSSLVIEALKRFKKQKNKAVTVRAPSINCFDPFVWHTCVKRPKGTTSSHWEISDRQLSENQQPSTCEGLWWLFQSQVA